MDGDGAQTVREMYQSQLAAAGVTGSDKILSWLTGNRGTALTYVNIVPNITLTLGISALPVVTSAWTLKDHKQLKSTVESALRITMLVALPCGILLSVLAEPLMYLIYGQADISEIVGMLLHTLGIATIFMCLVAPINSILQAVGRADIPVKIIIVGGVVKLILNIVLIMQPAININGSSYSTLICYIVMVVLSLRAVRRVIGIHLQWSSVVIKPLLASLLCGAAGWGTNWIFEMLLPRRIASIPACVVAGVVYLIALIMLKAFTREDILMLPKGKKIAEVLEKHGKIG